MLEPFPAPESCHYSRRTSLKHEKGVEVQSPSPTQLLTFLVHLLARCQLAIYFFFMVVFIVVVDIVQ